MKYFTPFFVLFLFACQPKETCSVEDLMFQKPSFDSLYSMSFEEFWDADEEIDSVLCEKRVYTLNVGGYWLVNPYMPLCEDDVIGCGFRHRDFLEVVITNQGFRVKDSIYSQESLLSLYNAFYFNNGRNPEWSRSPNRAWIGIGWDSTAHQKDVERALISVCEYYIDLRKSLIPIDSAACEYYRNNRSEIAGEYPAKFWIMRDKEMELPPPSPILFLED